MDENDKHWFRTNAATVVLVAIFVFTTTFAIVTAYYGVVNRITILEVEYSLGKCQ
jgi:hypothetical protein